MTFSSALTLTDLNDFITPSQACIKPVEQLNGVGKDFGAAATEIQIDRTGAYYEYNRTSTSNEDTPPPRKLEQAQINLNDCLACSGCITSAESILITLQSHIEVLNFLEANNKNRHSTDKDDAEPYKIPVISISPQTLASLAAAVAASSPSSSTSPPPTPKQILRRLRKFCIQALGFTCVFDTTFARHLALREHVAEFEERRRGAGKSGHDETANGEGVKDDNHGGGAHGLPMLASSCPGWVCYAEKAHSEMLPFISRTKSPQQIMGTLVKNWMGTVWNKLPNEIYHVTVMPCYDKKLEASRTDFYNAIFSTRDVDCVITTGELELMIKEKGWDITLPVPGELDDDENIFNPFLDGTNFLPYPNGNHHSPPVDLPELLIHPGTSSGSYLHTIITHIRDTSPVPLTLRVNVVRGADYEEFTLLRNADVPGQEETIVFKGAKCYGFRNLQNVVRRVGREKGLRTTTGAAGKMAGRTGSGANGTRRLGRRAGDGKVERGYDYVEVMACPGGCVNGGGQLKPILTASAPVPMADDEGFKRDWEGSGVAIVPPSKNGTIDVLQSARWGSKEWTRRVEEEYWRDTLNEMKNGQANRLATRVYEDLCGPREEIQRGERRRKYFRTQYHAVESEVTGLAVVW